MTQVQSSFAADGAGFLEGIRTVAAIADQALRRLDDALERSQRKSAEEVLRYQRDRIEHWKAADAPRILQLDDAVGPAEKLTADEKAHLEVVLVHKPRGRPGGKSGPGTLLELLRDISVWSQTPTATPSERRMHLGRYPFARILVAQLYASELMRLRLEDGGKRRARGQPSRYQLAEQAVADLFGISPAVVRTRRSGWVEAPTSSNDLIELRAWVETGID